MSVSCSTAGRRTSTSPAGCAAAAAWSALTTFRGVHLGLKTGRVSGRRFGYSQVVNPIYLIRKGSVPALRAAAACHATSPPTLFRSLRPEPHVDRRGRLRGNLLGPCHVLSGRIEPEHALI